jgi:hypothetical protein
MISFPGRTKSRGVVVSLMKLSANSSRALACFLR